MYPQLAIGLITPGVRINTNIIFDIINPGLGKTLKSLVLFFIPQLQAFLLVAALGRERVCPRGFERIVGNIQPEEDCAGRGFL